MTTTLELIEEYIAECKKEYRDAVLGNPRAEWEAYEPTFIRFARWLREKEQKKPKSETRSCIAGGPMCSSPYCACKN